MTQRLPASTLTKLFSLASVLCANDRVEIGSMIAADAAVGHCNTITKLRDELRVYVFTRLPTKLSRGLVEVLEVRETGFAGRSRGSLLDLLFASESQTWLIDPSIAWFVEVLSHELATAIGDVNRIIDAPEHADALIVPYFRRDLRDVVNDILVTCKFVGEHACDGIVDVLPLAPEWQTIPMASVLGKIVFLGDDSSDDAHRFGVFVDYGTKYGLIAAGNKVAKEVD